MNGAGVNRAAPGSENGDLLGVFMGLNDGGGVARYSRNAGAAMARIAPKHNVSPHFYALTDPWGSGAFTADRDTCPMTGFALNRRALAIACVRRARRTNTVLLGHPNLAPIGLAMKLVNRSLRYFVTSHGVDVWEPLSLIRRSALRYASLNLPVSTHTAQMLMQLQGVPTDRIKVFHNCIDDEFARVVPGRLAASTHRAPTILTVARLVSSDLGKGVDTVIESLPTVRGEIPDVQYVVAGTGDLVPRLKALAMSKGVDNCVTFVGQVSDDELRQEYAGCDVFVLPSRQEGFGIVFLEAMASSKPVIGTGEGGIPDIIRDGHNGYLIPYGDSGILSARLIELLHNEQLRARLGAYGRGLVVKDFTFQTFLTRLEHVLFGHEDSTPCGP